MAKLSTRTCAIFQTSNWMRLRAQDARRAAGLFRAGSATIGAGRDAQGRPEDGREVRVARETGLERNRRQGRVAAPEQLQRPRQPALLDVLVRRGFEGDFEFAQEAVQS